MQRGLIDHRAGEKRLAVVESREGQTLKPVCPLAAQMALDSRSDRPLVDLGSLSELNVLGMTLYRCL